MQRTQQHTCAERCTENQKAEHKIDSILGAEQQHMWCVPVWVFVFACVCVGKARSINSFVAGFACVVCEGSLSVTKTKHTHARSHTRYDVRIDTAENIAICVGARMH